MPALEMAQETGKCYRWRKKEGERVTKGEALLEVETDKAVVEIEATGDGILAGVTAPEGAVMPVGQNIAWLVQPGEQPPKEIACPCCNRATGGSVPAAQAAAAAAATAPAVNASADVQDFAEGAAAGEGTGVDLGRVRGSGADGEILACGYRGGGKGRSTGRAGGIGTPAAPIPAGGRRNSRRHRPPDGRAHHAELDHRPHFFVTREVDASACWSRAREARSGDRKVARREGHADRSAGRAGGSRADQASAPQCQLDWRGHSPASATSISASPWPWKTAWSRP